MLYFKSSCFYRSNIACCYKSADVWNKYSSVYLICCSSVITAPYLTVLAFYSVLMSRWVLPTSVGLVIHKGIYMVLWTKVGTSSAVATIVIPSLSVVIWFSFNQFGCMYDDVAFISGAGEKLTAVELRNAFWMLSCLCSSCFSYLSQWDYSILMCSLILLITLSMESLR